MPTSEPLPPEDPHVPVLLSPILEHAAPVSGVWLDGTFGAGGYTRALLEAGADRVIAVDRDPSVFALAAGWAGGYGERLQLVEGTFGALDTYADGLLSGVVLDLGVSSMQLDQAERGFSFLRDGPLDMRMSAIGPSAADLVNELDEKTLADVLYNLGEERASRRIARAIVTARAEAPIQRTGELAQIVSACLPRPKPGQSHPATRSFQALRIAVNDELGELVRGLEAAERALVPEGRLAVVSFHSIEDRVVKRFFQQSDAPRGSRYAPPTEAAEPRFVLAPRKAIAASDAEIAANPRARSARLRMGLRTAAPARPADRKSLGLPPLYTLTEDTR